MIKGVREPRCYTMTKILDFLREEQIDPALVQELARYQAAHPLDGALCSRVPVPRYLYYGRGNLGAGHRCAALRRKPASCRWKSDR